MQTESLDSSRYSDARSFNSSHFRSFASQQTDELADFVSLQDLFLSNKAIELMLDYIEHGIFPQDSEDQSMPPLNDENSTSTSANIVQAFHNEVDTYQKRQDEFTTIHEQHEQLKRSIDAQRRESTATNHRTTGNQEDLKPLRAERNKQDALIQQLEEEHQELDERIETIQSELSEEQQGKTMDEEEEEEEDREEEERFLLRLREQEWNNKQQEHQARCSSCLERTNWANAVSSVLQKLSDVSVNDVSLDEESGEMGVNLTLFPSTSSASQYRPSPTPLHILLKPKNAQATHRASRSGSFAQKQQQAIRSPLEVSDASSPSFSPSEVAYLLSFSGSDNSTATKQATGFRQYTPVVQGRGDSTKNDSVIYASEEERNSNGASSLSPPDDLRAVIQAALHLLQAPLLLHEQILDLQSRFLVKPVSGSAPGGEEEKLRVTLKGGIRLTLAVPLKPSPSSFQQQQPMNSNSSLNMSSYFAPSSKARLFPKLESLEGVLCGCSRKKMAEIRNEINMECWTDLQDVVRRVQEEFEALSS